MNSISLIVITVILLVILVVLVMVYVFRQHSAKTATNVLRDMPARSTQPQVTFDTLAAVIKDRASSAEDLKSASETILKKYGKIEKKLGMRPHPEFERYAEVVYWLCSHPNVRKETILAFDKGLVSRNKEYREELDEALKKGLSARE